MTCYGYRNPFMTTRPQVIRSGALLIPQNQGEGGVEWSAPQK